MVQERAAVLFSCKYQITVVITVVMIRTYRCNIIPITCCNRCASAARAAVKESDAALIKTSVVGTDTKAPL